jgi:nucleotide-binding universal stress UspA family protein
MTVGVFNGWGAPPQGEGKSMAPFQTILVPLDGSPLAERAIAPAMRIARAMAKVSADAPGEPVRLVLLRAVSPTVLVAADPMLYEELGRMSQEEALSYLHSTRDTLEAGDVVVDVQVVNGAPADAIVHYSETHDVDLIVISSHGRTGGSRWVYGSVAEKVLHHAPCAVAVIRSQAEVEMFEKRTILVPLDGSPLAERALEPALAIAQGVGCDIMLARFLTSAEPVPEGLATPDRSYEEYLATAAEMERAEAETYLQHVYASLPTGHAFFDVIVGKGDVADALVDYAARHHVDLIVMSSHGRSGVSRWLYGSVAEKVLRGAHCATLIVRGQ